MSADRKLRIFISYARADASAFAEQLLCGLEAAQFDAFLDRHDIVGGEEWERRLSNAISQADTILCVISPASNKSDAVSRELRKALELSKRIIPVVGVDAPIEGVPDELRKINFIYFTQPHQPSFAAGLKELCDTLRTDIDWLREHTRLGELAARWREKGEAEESLLRGAELQSALQWKAGWRRPSPEPTSLHAAFLNASVAAEEHRENVERLRLKEIETAQRGREAMLQRLRRNTIIWRGILLGLGALMLAGGAYAGMRLQDQQREIEDQQNQIDLQQAQIQEFLNASEKVAALEAQAGVDSEISDVDGSAEPVVSEQDAARQAQARLQLEEARRERDIAAAKAVNDVEAQKIASGIDVDLFYCTGPAGDANLRNAQAILDRLVEERERQLTGDGVRSGRLGFEIGRVRLREFTEAQNARQAFQIKGNEIRHDPDGASAPGMPESELAQRLGTYIGAVDGSGLGMVQTSGNNPTAYYLSVFLCGA